jgi:two-component system phosphate regulon sensor histidine kinase PhoR
VTARIFFKLLVVVALVMAIALTAIDFLASALAERSYVQGLTNELTSIVRMLDVVSRSGPDALAQVNVRSLAQAAGGRLTVVAADGRVLADSEADPARMENHAHRPEIIAAIQGRIGTSVRPSPTLHVESLYVAGPVHGGVARIAVPLSEVRAQVIAVRKRLLGYIAISFLPAILVAALFARAFSRRLGLIIDYASTLATGNFQVRLENTGRDELGILASQLNQTASKLQRVFEELEHEHSELEKVERIRKDFVINVSHELRTPLASIQGYAETLLSGALHDPQHNVRFLQIIHQNAERLTRLTEDLLTLSRIELKSQRFHPGYYRIVPLLDDAIDSLRPLAAKKGISLHREPGGEAAEAFCDSEAVHEVMSNLLDNAIKYTPDGGRIAVIVTPEQGFWRVGVRDTGMGIPAEELPRLFERFYRVDKARSRELGGTGLGLAIVKHLVRSMGGDTLVESVPGEGSTFSFTLPEHEPPPETGRS